MPLHFLQPLILKHSKLLVIWLLVIHWGAAICIAYLPYLLAIKFLLWVICLSHLLILWRRRISLNRPRAISKIVCLLNGDWGLIDRQGQLQRCRLLRYSVVTRFFMLLHFTTHSTRQRILLILACDALDRTEFRRLQVHILTQRL
jgi:hypothetical protein